MKLKALRKQASRLADYARRLGKAPPAPCPGQDPADAEGARWCTKQIPVEGACVWAALAHKGRAQLPGSDERLTEIADICDLPCPDSEQSVDALRARINKAAFARHSDRNSSGGAHEFNSAGNCVRRSRRSRRHGCEQFVVERRHEDDTVWYAIQVYSRPSWWPVWLVLPYARYQQRRFQRLSGEAIMTAIHNSQCQPTKQ